MEIIKVVNNVPAEAWEVIAELFVSALIVSPLALALKKWWKIHSEKAMLFMVIFGSFASALLLYVTEAVPAVGPWIIGLQGWLVFATTQPVYFLFVKPVCRRVGMWFSDQVTKAAQLNEVKTAELPAEGLAMQSVQQDATVVRPPQLEVTDFSK